MTDRTIAPFQISTDEDFRFQYVWANMSMAGRSLRVIVKERATNTVRATLTLGNGLTLTGTDTVTGSVAQATSAAWPRGEYEVDLHDITGGSNTRLVGGRAVLDHPGNLVYGVRGNKATVTMTGNQAIVTGIGGIGPPGPANTLTIPVDGVETVAPDQPAEVTITDDPPNQELRFKIPRGLTGDDGEKGWGPVFAIATDGNRRVLRLAGWSGGEGAPPPTTSSGNPLYVGPTGLTTTIGDASDVRGAIGLTGDPGIDGTDGLNGWTPILAVVEDAGRRVLQIADWTGGTGSEPASGGYIGPTGIVGTAAEAVNIRGDQGPAGSVADGDKVGIVVSDGGTSWAVKPKHITFARMQDIGQNEVIGRVASGTGEPKALSSSEQRTASGITGPGSAVVTATTVSDQHLALGLRHGVAASASAGALTVALKDTAGADATATTPVIMGFRSATAGSGTLVRQAVTAALSLVLSSGSTMGVPATGTAFALWLVAFDDAGTVRLGLINCVNGSHIYPLGCYPIDSSTAEGGAGAADSPHVFYTAAAVTAKAYVPLARLTWESGLTTLGTWTAPSRIELWQAGMKLPGDVIQRAHKLKTDTFSVSNTNYNDVTGLDVTLTPRSAANLFRIEAVLNYITSAGDTYACRLLRNGTQVGGGDAAGSRPQVLFGAMRTTDSASLSNNKSTIVDAPNSASPLTYKLQAYTGGGTLYVNRTIVDTNNTTVYRASSSIEAQELLT